MTDLVLVIILVVIIGAAVIYIRKEKKRGVRCIGCPTAGECARRHQETSECGCGCHADTK